MLICPFANWNAWYFIECLPLHRWMELTCTNSRLNCRSENLLVTFVWPRFVRNWLLQVLFDFWGCCDSVGKSKLSVPLVIVLCRRNFSVQRLFYVYSFIILHIYWIFVIAICKINIVWSFRNNPCWVRLGGKKVAKSQLYLATDTTPLEQLWAAF